MSHSSVSSGESFRCHRECLGMRLTVPSARYRGMPFSWVSVGWQRSSVEIRAIGIASVKMINAIENHPMGPPNETVPSGILDGAFGLGRFIGAYGLVSVGLVL